MRVTIILGKFCTSPRRRGKFFLSDEAFAATLLPPLHNGKKRLS
jgi:hypothetical protein